ncbi:MAG: hypothetical protein VKI81_10440 [Synechococcaceae cyanobacterium]|nr:hypothetical protein [Synechococcaceae cyanobacterium]
MSFQQDLDYSHAASDSPVWESIYRSAFPTFLQMVDCRELGDHQRKGIDRIIVLRNAKAITVDEKVRRQYFPIAPNLGGFDVALEYISVDRHPQKPGWVCNPDITADYIAYCVSPAGKGVLLPVVQLQSAWEKKKEEWFKKYKPRKTHSFRNKGYSTHFLPVPVNEIMRHIGSELRVSFAPNTLNEKG